MVITSFMFDLSECESIQTTNQWVAWLRKAQSGVPKIWPHEENVLGVWTSFQKLNAVFRSWRSRTNYSLDEIQPAMKEFVALQSMLHAAIIDASFPIETVAGLAVMLSIRSTELRLSDASKEDYDRFLEWAAIQAAELSFQSYSVTPTTVLAVIPNKYRDAQTEEVSS